MYTLNAYSVSAEMHEMLIDDSDLYRASVESGHKDILMDIDPSMMDTFFAFFHLKLSIMNVKKRKLQEAEKKWLKIPSSEKKEITFEEINEQMFRCPFAECDMIKFLLTLSVKDLYGFTEILNFILSKSLTFAISTIDFCFKQNTKLLEGIINYSEEKNQMDTALRRHQEDFINWVTAGNEIDNNYEPCRFRFTDEIWILLKIGFFCYTVVKTAGCVFVSTEKFAVFSRLEPKTPSEMQMLNYPRFVTKVELENQQKILTDHYGFSLNYCRITYNDGSAYRGSVLIHPIAGFIRHGDGCFYHGDTILQEGKFIFDTLHKSIFDEEDCECKLCNCYNMGQAFPDEDDDSDYAKCYFHTEKYETNIWLCDDEDIVRFDYCFECSEALKPYQRVFDDSLLGTSAAQGDNSAVSIKLISTYEDYVHYLMKYS
jgi:hypothetical protein